ncbi:hypothetical protein CPAR01_09215 [Colletotrichum paranaense]|uniref:Uncharacterized protein n=1 Tax=Colletotrichum paranaense TaxID=1914294 RepID=A0ABQ9SG39_9PEZI|nr:uncharacterized protein CPAR01_09215 [Colletotrichum paranaense]KAK1535673.1 hypothetical protein CPAR01_09215 [Colletotrichum paranaense]
MQVPEVLCNNTYRYLWRLPLEQNGHRPSALGPDQKPPPPLRAFSDPPEIGNGPPGALADWIWSTWVPLGRYLSSPHVLNWAWLRYIHLVPLVPSPESAKRQSEGSKVGNGGPRNLIRRHLTILACAVVRTAREVIATRGSLSCASPWWFFSFPSFRLDTSGLCYLLNTSGHHLRSQTIPAPWIPHGHQKKSPEGGRRPLGTIIGSLPGS